MRAETHLRIGRLLAAYTPPEKQEEGIFEIVNQLNRASHLITSAEERERVAELNFIAGRLHHRRALYDPSQLCAIGYFAKISSTRLNAFSAAACGVAPSFMISAQPASRQARSGPGHRPG